MRSVVTAAAIAALLVLAGAPGGADATELAGPPVRIASGPLNTVQAVVAPDADGGFATFTMRNVDGDVFFDKLFARFYGRDRKPVGAAFRFDGKIMKASTVGVFLNGGVRLGDGGILVPYIANLTESGAPVYLAQLFVDGRKSGKPRTIRPAVSTPYPPVELRDGRALVSWDPAGGDYQQYAFAAADGDVDKKAKSFASNYVLPTAIEGGFATLFVSGAGPFAVNARIYDAAGKPVREFELASADTSSQLPGRRLVGLSNGDIALLLCERDAATGRCAITGQRFSIKGKKLGGKVVLVEDAPAQVLTATHLPDGGLLASFTEDDGGTARIVHRSFDGKLEPRGMVEEVRPAGSVSGGLTTLTDGRVAARYLVNGEETEVFVQIVVP